MSKAKGEAKQPKVCACGARPQPLGLRERSGRQSVDDRIVLRRDCEFEIFRSVERACRLPRILAGFNGLDDFLALAQSILQSRKTRAGNSLELHAREILVEEGFRPNVDFHYKPTTELGKRPDFLFPNQRAYEDPSFPTERLRMLAAKTTCKDRWRQAASEANRITRKHLLTLQEGLSESQFSQMRQEGIVLVVPSNIQKSYPASIRPELLSLESFLAELRVMQATP